ncbi:peptidase C25 [Cochleicola gelatinilyticus]|uniref:Peptidase C25 n=2 Tax=Cochleicola gelatinilyticus TaxID=1763537 RepID=A0A167JEK3_9FLAO|nr:peptidase C25 [Cochleicola gelatinilyticus]
MKRILFLIVFLVFPFIVEAQVKTVTINWQQEVPSKSSVASKTNSQSSKNAKTSIFGVYEGGSTTYVEQWEDTGYADKNSLQISNVRYGNLSSEELKRIDSATIPETLQYSINSTKAREKLFTQVAISSIVKQNGVFKKVLSFSISYSKSIQNRSIGARLPLSNSVLATGDWYKFKVEKTGVYRLTKDFLEDLGMNTGGINPRNLKVYGNGGMPLPLLNIDNTIFDLPENPIQVVGEEDGTFNNGDHILFYAVGTRGPINYKDGTSEATKIDTHVNPYDDNAYYYVTVSGGQGLRIQPMVQPTGAANEVITTFNDYQFYEEDDFSPAKVGRRWYGNRFDIENDQTFEFLFPNIVSSAPMDVVIEAAAASEIGTSFAVSVNQTSLNAITFTGLNGTLLLTKRVEVDIPASEETATVEMNYNNGGNPASIGYLDFISIEALRELTGVEGQLAFKYNASENLSGIGQYQISNAAQFSQVWDVTNLYAVSAVENQDSEGVFTFKAPLGQLRNYVAVNPNDYFAPLRVPNPLVQNQDVKGTVFKDASGNFQDIDYLIITSPFLLQPALRLANHRSSVDGLNIKVVTTDKIYEEFSSGKQDIGAIRNFVRYVYENASSDEKRVKYLCLFGDTSVDYKNRLTGNNNIVPVFHTLKSISTTSDFMTDDFYGSMDPMDGFMKSNELLDIAVGRIVADEVSLANSLVDKIITYDSKKAYGNWRNTFTLISDDVDESSYEYRRIEATLDSLGQEITRQKPFVNVKKIHSDAFQQETSAGGNRYPEVNKEILNNIEVGSLIVDYFGHGGEDGLAKEFIFTKQDAQSLKNKEKLPLIVTVTCEFTKFDLPTRVTAGELTYWNKDGGAIALITTTRSISVSLGVTFNEKLAAQLFGFDVNVPAPPAEGLRISKNDISDGLKRVVHYIGDPAMHLAFPNQKIRITSLNDVPIEQATDTLKALSRVRFGGEVVDVAGTLQADYNGVLEAQVFDKRVERQTLGNDGIRFTSGPNNGELQILNFTTLGNVIFNGKATVTNGKFNFEFVVPRDIRIPVGQGKISLYAQKNNELEDHTGFNLDINVGGINENAPEDNVGPVIQLFMNDESFVSGGVTNDSPIFIAKLEDENGINTSSGIGHDMVAILDGDESNPFVLNDYYQAEVDDYTRGIANFPFRDLEDGLHTLTFKAWDVYNNSSTAEIQFVVAGNDQLVIERVLNYPNPFVNYTEFWFSHNRENEPLDVQVQVFTVTGKIVWTKTDTFAPTGSNLFRSISWNGLDDFGDRVGKGVYVYKITVKSTLTNQQVEKFEKLVIL